MHRISSPRIPAQIAGFLLLGASLTHAETLIDRGLVIEGLDEHRAGDLAGLEPGDLLVSWTRSSAQNEPSRPARPFETPFDILDAELEEAPRGSVLISARRGGRSIEIEMPPGSWRIDARPHFVGPALDRFQETRAAREAGDVDAAVQGLRSLAALLERAGHPHGAAWSLLESGRSTARKDRFEEAEADFARAIAVLRDDPSAEARLHSMIGRVWLEREELLRSEKSTRSAVTLLRRLAPGSLLLASDLDQLCQIWADQGAVEKAEQAGHEALAIAEKEAPESVFTAWVLQSLGIAAAKRQDLVASEQFQMRALAILERAAPDGIEVAIGLSELGLVALDLDQMDVAEQRFSRCIDIIRSIAPKDLQLGRCLANLGMTMRSLGRLDEAERYFNAAMEIEQDLAPNGRNTAIMRNNLGGLAFARGELAAAQDHFSRALEVFERHSPGSGDVAAVLSNLGGVTLTRGLLSDAETHLLRALEIYQGFENEHLNTARALTNLGVTHHYAGDSRTAIEYLRQARALFKKLAPEGLGYALALTNVGEIQIMLGELDEAEAGFRRALEIQNEITPDGLTIARTRRHLGDAHFERGQLDAARLEYEKSRELWLRHAPGSLDLAETLERLGHVALEQNELETAERWQLDVLAIREELAPGSSRMAQTLHALGRIALRKGGLSAALTNFRQAADVLEEQRRWLAGTEETRAEFSARHAPIYRDLQQALIDAGHLEEAFHALERSRARSLLDLLATRDLVFSEVPTELEQRRRAANIRYDETLLRLVGQSLEHDAETRETLRRELREVRREQAEIEAAIRAAAPRSAFLRDPEALSAQEVRRNLDPGTLVLAFSFGETSGHVFALGPAETTDAAPLEVFTLELGAGEIRDLVERFRATIEQSSDAELVRAQAAELSRRLLAPAAESVRRAERLMILPDGPLYYLPFAALLDPNDPDRWLVESTPLFTAASASVYMQLRATRRTVSTPRVVAFGDPAYGEAGSRSPEEPILRALNRDGLELEALPSSRLEVEGLSRLFKESSRIHLGEAASEEAAKSVGADASILHFACHSVIDESSPLDSALALSIPEHWRPGQENGLLQAWEVFEQMRLDADLVTLSACSTGLGQSFAGEGMLGLTRAFQFAGARSVLASLWAIHDRSTSRLMQRFYGYLRAGESKAEALRHAQLDRIEGRERVEGLDLAHPYAWAAFGLIGDWR